VGLNQVVIKFPGIKKFARSLFYFRIILKSGWPVEGKISQGAPQIAKMSVFKPGTASHQARV